ncbi:MAG: hypothetical protein NZ554_07750 [Bryobacteraceae bacterium]|nr:hypothetical protein [Bryobacteraceae bacterium]
MRVSRPPGTAIRARTGALFAIGSYELTGDDAGLAATAQASLNAVRCRG